MDSQIRHVESNPPHNGQPKASLNVDWWLQMARRWRLLALLFKTSIFLPCLVLFGSIWAPPSLAPQVLLLSFHSLALMEIVLGAPLD